MFFLHFAAFTIYFLILSAYLQVTKCYTNNIKHLVSNSVQALSL